MWGFAYDLRDRNPEERQLKDLALTAINNALLAMNKSLDLFPGVPKPSVQVTLDEIFANEPVRGPSPESLNSDQRSALDKILQIIQSRTGQSSFVDGPGGTGKTYLYSAILRAAAEKGWVSALRPRDCTTPPSEWPHSSFNVQHTSRSC